MKQIIVFLLIAYSFHYSKSVSVNSIFEGIKSVETIVKTVKNITDAVIDAFHLSSSPEQNEQLSNLNLDILTQQIETLDKEIKKSLADVVTSITDVIRFETKLRQFEDIKDRSLRNDRTSYFT